MEIIKVYTRNKPIENVDLDELTRKTSGFTGADLENLCNEVRIIGPLLRHLPALARAVPPSTLFPSRYNPGKFC
jgi:hypothetical protein